MKKQVKKKEIDFQVVGKSSDSFWSQRESNPFIASRLFNQKASSLSIVKPCQHSFSGEPEIRKNGVVWAGLGLLSEKISPATLSQVLLVPLLLGCLSACKPEEDGGTFNWTKMKSPQTGRCYEVASSCLNCNGGLMAMSELPVEECERKDGGR